MPFPEAPPAPGAWKELRVGIQFYKPAAVQKELERNAPKFLAYCLGWSGRNAHQEVLQNVLMTEGAERTAWLKCSRILRDLRAPVDNAAASGIDAFISTHWDDKGFIEGLLREYIADGLIDVNHKLSGDITNEQMPMDFEWFKSEGQSPLAVAMAWKCKPLMRVLLESGASLDLGPLTVNGRPYTAARLAERIDDPEITAILTEANMKAAGKPSEAPVATAQAPRRASASA